MSLPERHFLLLDITNIEPLLLGRNHEAGNIIRSHDYIPGGVILGAFAGEYCRLPGKGASDSDFMRWFLSDNVRFENAYLVYEDEPCLPFPLSTFSCKDFGGRHWDAENKIERAAGWYHGFYDFLASQPDRCGRCPARMEQHRGYYVKLSGQYYDVAVSKRIVTHNAVSDELQRPLETDGALFSYEVIAEERRFKGIITFASEDELIRFRNTFRFVLEHSKHLTLGRAKNRGYGKIVVKKANYFRNTKTYRQILGKPPLSIDSFSERLSRKLNSSLSFFSLTLISDAIVCDDFLRYQTLLSGEILQRELPLPDGQIQLLKDSSYASFLSIDGFNAKWRMPRESEVAIAKGSAFLYSFNGDLNVLKAGLEQLEADGIGFRRNEGFGRFIANDDFHVHNHWRNRENACAS